MHQEKKEERDAEMQSRLTILIKEIGGRRKSSAIAGVSEEMIRRYANGSSRVALEPVGKLCDEANISLNWLWSGEGHQYKEIAPSEHYPLKEKSAKYDALAKAMTHVPNGYQLPSKLTALILELVSDYDVNPTAINRIIEVVAELDQAKNEEK